MDKSELTGLGKQIKYVRNSRGYTAEYLAEQCNINATYLRQIECGMKIPSLPVFVAICNALDISPDYLLQDELKTNEISQIKEIEALWDNSSPNTQNIILAMIKAALESNN